MLHAGCCMSHAVLYAVCCVQHAIFKALGGVGIYRQENKKSIENEVKNLSKMSLKWIQNLVTINAGSYVQACWASGGSRSCKNYYFLLFLSPTWLQKAPTRQWKNQSGSNMTSRKGSRTLQGPSEDLRDQFWRDFWPYFQSIFFLGGGRFWHLPELSK